MERSLYFGYYGLGTIQLIKDEKISKNSAVLMLCILVFFD
jgi:hypothetical protein